MTLSTSQLSDRLNSVVSSTDFSGVQRAAEGAAQNLQSTLMTTLGSQAGQIQGGIQALTQDLDDAEFFDTAQRLATVTRATQDIPGIAQELIGNVQFPSEIEAITETAGAAANGFLHDIVGAANPQAIQTALESAVGANFSQIQGALNQLTTTALQGVLANAINIPAFTEFTGQLDTFLGQLNQNIGSISDVFMVDFNESIQRNFENRVVGLTDRQPPQEVIQEGFRRLSTGSVGRPGGSTSTSVPSEIRRETFETTVRPYIDTPPAYEEETTTLPPEEWSPEVREAEERIRTAETEFEEVDISLNGTVVTFTDTSGAAGTNSNAPTLIGSPDTGGGTARGNNTGATYTFSDINSLDELEAEFRNIRRPAGREICGVISHWAATFLDQNVGADEIDDWHKERGFDGCGYHYIIRRDGTFQRGRPANMRGAHAIKHNARFLGLCFIGGYNATYSEARGVSNNQWWRWNSSSSFTNLQWQAYDGFMRTFYRVYPYGQANGHYIEQGGKEDPGFNVAGYSAARFNKPNVIPDGDALWRADNAITLDTLRRYGANV